MFEEFPRLAHILASPGRSNVERLRWVPAADIYRTQNGWLIKMELAGVRPDEIQLRITGRMLTISGERRDWMIAEASECYSLEIAYSHFERKMEVPCDLEHCQIQTEFRDGMLLVRVIPEETD